MSYRTHDIPVTGGILHVGIWGDGGPVLICAHGLSANHMSYQALANELSDDFTLVAPDHRGRGRSSNITGPWGMKAHADDVAAVMRYLDLKTVPLMLGHSMGAFISAVTHHRYGERIDQLLFIDGGLPLFDRIPEGASPEDLVTSIVGPAMTRLNKEFSSVQEYLAFWRQHPALQEFWDADLENYFRYELAGDIPHLKCSVNKVAILGDTESQLMSHDVANALAALRAPVTFLQAPRGIMNDGPIYPLDRLAIMQQRIPQFEVKVIEDVNHYSILMAQSGARQIAGIVRQLLL
jgi:lipase